MTTYRISDEKLNQMYKGGKHMFDKKKMLERGQAILNAEIPKNSGLAKYLERYPDAKITSSYLGWITELPEEAYPELKLPCQRIHVWNKNGKEGPQLKGMPREM